MSALPSALRRSRDERHRSHLAARAGGCTGGAGADGDPAFPRCDGRVLPPHPHLAEVRRSRHRRRQLGSDFKVRERAVFEISHVSLHSDDSDEAAGGELVAKTVDWLDKHEPGWRDREGTSCYFTQVEPNTVRVVPAPAEEIAQHSRRPNFPLRNQWHFADS